MSTLEPRGAGRSRSRACKTSPSKKGQPKSFPREAVRRATARRTASRRRELATKRRGELSELAFVYKAASKGFAVAKPFGDSERYDCILDNGHRLWRIQIKATTTLLDGLYHVNAGRHTNGQVLPYQPSEIDFLAAHVIPEDSWFLIPISILQDRISLLLPSVSHRRSSSPYATYREAWRLLRIRQM
jgi:hypothetical protein